ncbi:MAG: 4-alpha-glucanotransferase, partial [Betaproteobacteria bacterium]
MNEPRLAELARRHGVATAYEDVWGERHEASAATLRAVLAAMHVDATDAARIEAAIAGHEYARRAQTLPAALVVRVAALTEGIRLQLPAALAEHALAWRVIEEGGRVYQGSFNLRNLRLIETFDVDGQARRAVQLGLPATLAPGYHRLEVLDGMEPLAQTTLIVAPDRCYLPDTLVQGGRAWGTALQLYSLRSARNWGIGDYTDLAIVVAQWGARGANIIGVNPLHALFLHDAGHA